MKIYLLLAVMLFACAEEADFREDLPRVEAACLASFDAALIAYEEKRGDVPVACKDLPSEYAVHFLDNIDDVCGEAPRGEKVVGCHYYRPEKVIYLLKGPEAQYVDASAHEWLHAIQVCVEVEAGTSDWQYDHTDEELWSRHGAATVEARAVQRTSFGPCL
jgi:hypothetical protein